VVSHPRLRRATNADCEPVRSLVFTVLGEYHLSPDPACTDADLRDIEQSYFHRGGVFYVLEEEDSTIIGSYGLFPIADCGLVRQVGLQIADSLSVGAGPRACPDGSTPCEGAGNHGGLPLQSPDAVPATCELRKMYLHRDYRGKGHGRGLLEHALAEARRLGFRNVTLETASVLKEAIHLYEHYGFQPCQPTHLSPRCDQGYMLELK
jgi:putative acetyltransferase